MSTEQYKAAIDRLLEVADAQAVREVYRVANYICIHRQQRRQQAAQK